MVHEDAGFAYQLQSEESKYLHCTVIGRDYIIFEGDSEGFAHFSAKNLIEVGLMGEKS